MDPQEVELTLDECITILSNHGDSEFKALDAAQEILRSLNRTRKEKEEKIKDDILALTTTCDTEVKSIQSDAQQAREVELTHLSNQLQDISQHRDSVNQELEGLKVSLEKCEADREDLEHQKEVLEDTTTRVLPSIRHDVNLYSYMSGIRWQYDAEPNQVKGYLSSKKKVKTFTLDRQQNSQFFIANYLWEQVETEW